MRPSAWALVCLCLVSASGCGGPYSDGQAREMERRIATLDLRGGVRLQDAMAQLGVDLGKLGLLDAQHSSLARHSTYRLSRDYYLHLVTEYIVVPRDKENPRVKHVGIDRNAPE